MKNNNLSIICPIYNTEKYIGQLLDVLSRQTCDDFQLILIDDCSSDKSVETIKQYQKYFKSIVIHQNQVNRGVSYSRNIGLQLAKGDYVVFIDSDDLVETTYVENIYRGINSVPNDWSILYFDILQFYESTDGASNFLQTQKQYLKRKKLIQNLLHDNWLGGYSVNKVFKNKNIQQYHILFDNDIKVAEDLLFCVKYAIKSKDSIAYHICNSYFYRENPASVTHTFSNEKLENMMEARWRVSEVIDLHHERRIAKFLYLNSAILLSFNNKNLKVRKGILAKYLDLLFSNVIPFKKKVLHCLYLINYSLARSVYLKSKK